MSRVLGESTSTTRTGVVGRFRSVRSANLATRTSGCNSVSDGGVLPGACAVGRDIVWDLGTIATGANRAVQFVGKVTVSGLPDGTLLHGTARVRDVAGAAARAGVTTVVQ